jgi:malate/lactate dehydrogenase
VIEVVRANPQGLLLIATNPVDALTFAALRLSAPPASVPARACSDTRNCWPN